jgi:hypothetical protein
MNQIYDELEAASALAHSGALRVGRSVSGRRRSSG